jgi:hypothetical protein
MTIPDTIIPDFWLILFNSCQIILRVSLFIEPGTRSLSGYPVGLFPVIILAMHLRSMTTISV